MSDCIIQISRDNSFYGSGLTVGVALDGCDVGTLKNGEELRAVAAPGQHELSFYRYRRLDKTISFTIAEGQQNAFFTIKINASNRVDVVGGLKTKKQAKRPSGCLTALIVFLCLFGFIGAAFASCGSSSKPEKVGTSVSSSQQPPQQSDSGPETFGVGDQVVLDGVAVTLLSVTENSGQNYVSPDDGKVFVLCEFEIENNSSRDIASSTMLSFESYIDGYTTSLSLTAMMSSDEPQLDGTIAAGKKMKGVVGYEAPQDWSEIEIRFSPSFWGSEIVFEYKK